MDQDPSCQKAIRGTQCTIRSSNGQELAKDEEYEVIAKALCQRNSEPPIEAVAGMMGRTIRVPPTRVNSLLHSSSQSGQGNSFTDKIRRPLSGPLSRVENRPWLPTSWPVCTRCSGRPFRACRGRRWAERALAALNSYTIQTARDQQRRANHMAPSENMLEWIRSRKRSSPAVVCPCPETVRSVFSGKARGGGIAHRSPTAFDPPATACSFTGKEQKRAANTHNTWKLQSPSSQGTAGYKAEGRAGHCGQAEVPPVGPGTPPTPYCVTLVPDRTRKRKESQDAGLGHDGAELYNCHSLSLPRCSHFPWIVQYNK